MNNLGRKIRLIRETVLNWDQDQLAGALGLSRGAVANWERGGGISRKNAIALAEIAGISLDWLTRGKEDDPIVYQGRPRSIADQAWEDQISPPDIDEEFLRHLLVRLFESPLISQPTHSQADLLVSTLLRVARRPQASRGAAQVEGEIQGAVSVLLALLPGR